MTRLRSGTVDTPETKEGAKTKKRHCGLDAAVLFAALTLPGDV